MVMRAQSCVRCTADPDGSCLGRCCRGGSESLACSTGNQSRKWIATVDEMRRVSRRLGSVVALSD